MPVYEEPGPARPSVGGALIRAALAEDAVAMARIYNHYIANTIVTLEETAVSAADMAARLVETNAAKLPWLTAHTPIGVCGFAHASRWKGRCGYRHSVEATVYVDAAVVGQGLGTALYAALLARIREIGCHAIIGGVGLPNAASVALHEKFGFRKIGHFTEVGFKFGRWVDVGYWQLILPE